MWQHIGFSLLARLFWTKDLNIMHIWSDTLTYLDKILSIEMQYEWTRSRGWPLLWVGPAPFLFKLQDSTMLKKQKTNPVIKGLSGQQKSPTNSIIVWHYNREIWTVQESQTHSRGLQIKMHGNTMTQRMKSYPRRRVSTYSCHHRQVKVLPFYQITWAGSRGEIVEMRILSPTFSQVSKTIESQYC